MTHFKLHVWSCTAESQRYRMISVLKISRHKKRTIWTHSGHTDGVHGKLDVHNSITQTLCSEELAEHIQIYELYWIIINYWSPGPSKSLTRVPRSWTSVGSAPSWLAERFDDGTPSICMCGSTILWRFGRFTLTQSCAGGAWKLGGSLVSCSQMLSTCINFRIEDNWRFKQ